MIFRVDSIHKFLFNKKKKKKIIKSLIALWNEGGVFKAVNYQNQWKYISNVLQKKFLIIKQNAS